jgi:eukaryotic-like serine/threonine-protein kinase
VEDELSPTRRRGEEPAVSDVATRLSNALAGRYRVERELGAGGMATVYLAHDLRHDRDVAVKVLHPELGAAIGAERFLREIRVAASLHHPNIVPLYDSGEADGTLYYVMPVAGGESLRGRLIRDGALSTADAVRLAREVASGLDYAHRHGVVHRDIKAENVLLHEGHALIADFGIAKALTAARTQDGAVNTTLTQAGGSIGTPAYMAPEQAVADTVDHRTDLYAWGLLTYELLAGAHPFARHTTPQTMITAHLTEPPPPFKDSDHVPPTVAALVMQCLEKDPSRRPGSAAEVLASLDAVATTSTPVPSIASPAPTTPTLARSSRRRTAAVAAAGFALLAAAVVWFAREGERATAATAPAEESLAVLPLANLSGDKADDYFGIGLAEEITRALAKNGVRVIGRVSAATLQAKGLDERAIAKELGVTSLLTGAVQRAGGQLRINMTLVSASDGAVRWTEKYDRPIANVFAVQDEIARTVAATLLGSLRPSTSVAGNRAETSDPEAHALFLQGQLLFNRRGAPALRQAIALFEQASARDPRYARAQASLAMALAVLPAYVQDSTTPVVTSAVAAAQRAIAMDSTIAESYAALGYAYALLGELGLAEASYRRALALDSTLATAWGWYGLQANRLGDYRAAHERMRRAQALEPASLIARAWEAQVLLLERRYAAADSVSSVTIAMDSTFMLAYSWRANALLGLGRAAEAVALLEPRVAALSKGKPEEVHGVLAYSYARAGRQSDARALLESMRARSGGRYPSTGAVAATLEELGDHETAVAILGDAVARHDVWVVQFPSMHSYDRLRKDPRVAVMLRRLIAI